jgi:hypothetical protein
MKSSSQQVRQNKKPEAAALEANGLNSKQPPAFALSAGADNAAAQRKEGDKPEAKAEGGSVAKLKLHADTETVDRTKLSLGELMNAQVGHTWISMTYNDPTTIPADMKEPARSLVEMGYGSWGFWPLINRTGDHTYPEQSQKMVDMGLTPGSGTSDNPEHVGFSKNPFKWVPGRVEEPDMAHQPKGTIEYDLSQTQVDSLMKYIDTKRNANYNLYSFNCTTFGVDAVKAAGKSGPSGSMMGICLPNALYKDMYEQSEAGDKSVTLAPLAEGETQDAPKKK